MRLFCRVIVKMTVKQLHKNAWNQASVVKSICWCTVWSLLQDLHFNVYNTQLKRKCFHVSYNSQREIKIQTKKKIVGMHYEYKIKNIYGQLFGRIWWEMCEFSYFKPVSAMGLKENKVIAIFSVRTTIVKDDWQSAHSLDWRYVPFWARTPCASIQPSMDKSGESSINPPNQNHMLISPTKTDNEHLKP